MNILLLFLFFLGGGYTWLCSGITPMFRNCTWQAWGTNGISGIKPGSVEVGQVQGKHPSCCAIITLALNICFVLFCFVLGPHPFDAQGLLLAMSSEIVPGSGDHMEHQGSNPDPSWVSHVQGKQPTTVLLLWSQKMLSLRFRCI